MCYSPQLLRHNHLETEEISSDGVETERKPGLGSTGLLGEQSKVHVTVPPQDKWEELVSQDSHLEIFGHVSLMTLDTIMKCAFSQQGSVQTDRSVTALQGQGPVFPNGKDLPERQ